MKKWFSIPAILVVSVILLGMVAGINDGWAGNRNINSSGGSPNK
ncbi:MAG: hypothetical protein ABSB31_08740 [Dehalococcoidia bacterium]|jgi:hypothetical protein